MTKQGLDGGRRTPASWETSVSALDALSVPEITSEMLESYKSPGVAISANTLTEQVSSLLPAVLV